MPSMVFYGVNKPEAVWMRMAGVPRIAADGLGELWKKEKKAEPESYDDLRKWLSQLTDDSWQKVLPSDSPLQGNECKKVWRWLSGLE